MAISKRFLTILTACALCVAFFSGCASKTDKQVVNILSANYEEQIAIQLEYLKELYPDAEINITYMSSGKLAAKIQAEGQDTDIDILLSLSSGYANTLKEAGLLRSFSPDSSYKEAYSDPDNTVLPNGVWAGAILVNTKELSKLGLSEPISYEDLLDPVYKGHIVMASPNSSSTGYFFLYGLIKLYGEDEGWEYFDKLNENIMLYGESGSIPSSMVEKGEAAIGLGIDYEGMNMAENGKPVKVIFASEGAPYDYDTVLLVNRKSEPSDFVLDIMRTITSKEGNEVFNNYNIAVLEGESDKGNYPESFKLLDMTGIGDPDTKADFSEKWSQRYE
ncbi:MAG: extracellular solute-binding protein [Clostridiaceae bacterium]|nr:extracellular solute-binding protein [Clostridiaceae bacterium]